MPYLCRQPDLSLEIDGEALIAGDIVTVSYTRGDITSQNNGSLHPLIT